MKIAIVGTRTFHNYNLLQDKIIEYIPIKKINMIISGGAVGADTLAEKFALVNGIPTKIFYPNWTLHGKAAGIIRNKDIVEESDIIFAFWDGVSRGTKSTIKFARERNKDLVIVYI